MSAAGVAVWGVERGSSIVVIEEELVGSEVETDDLVEVLAVGSGVFADEG